MKSDQATWAKWEFGDADLGDARRVQRLIAVASDRAAKPDSSLPKTFGDRHQAKAGYRLYENASVLPGAIREAHYARSAERARIADSKIILAVQDTTHIDERDTDTWVHTTMLFTPDRVALGLVDQQVWQRHASKGSKKQHRKTTPTEEKESNKWLKGIEACQGVKLRTDQEIVSVADRECDLYDAFAEAERLGVKVIIRAAQDRRIVAAEVTHLWESVERQPVVSTFTVTVERNGNRPERKAVCELRFVDVKLCPPRNRPKSEQLQPCAVTAVLVREVAGSHPDGPAIEWLLLTTLAVSSVEDARQIVDFYAVRWMIEQYHKILKSGCKVEKRQFEMNSSFERYLAIDCVVAWRLLNLTYKARAQPDEIHAHDWNTQELRVLYATVHKQPPPPDLRFTNALVVLLVARLGGYLASPKRYPPGIIVVWRGIATFADILRGYYASKIVGKG